MGLQLAPMVKASWPLTLVCYNPQHNSVPKGTYIASVSQVHTPALALREQEALSLGPDTAWYQPMARASPGQCNHINQRLDCGIVHCCTAKIYINQVLLNISYHP